MHQKAHRQSNLNHDQGYYDYSLLFYFAAQLLLTLLPNQLMFLNVMSNIANDRM